MVLKWGILSCGKISNDFVSALKSLPQSDHKVEAVAARSLDSAKSFAENHSVPKFYEGYSKLADDKDIDVVYVGNLNPQHFEACQQMLEKGKHVLCEKPMTMNEKQTRSLIKLATSRKLVLLDGIWSRHFPVYRELKNILESGKIGDVLYVHVTHGFQLDGVERLNLKELGGGTILDLAVYGLQFQQFVFNNAKPLKVVATGFLNHHSVDLSTTTIITYTNGRNAVISTSSRAQMPNEAVIIGTKGIIKVPQYGCPNEIRLNDEVLTFPLPQKAEGAKFIFGEMFVGLSYEAEHVRTLVNSGQITSPNITHEESIELARLMDEIRRQVGVVFPEDYLDY